MSDQPPSKIPLSPRAIDAIQDIRSKDQITYFAGAAISLFTPSSLPPWIPFIKLIINALRTAATTANPTTAAHVSKCVDTVLAQITDGTFTTFATTETMARRLGISYLEVVQVFRGVRPNSVHTWLARELMSGVCPAIVTTNFDDAIENAYTELGGNVVWLGDVGELGAGLMEGNTSGKPVLVVVANGLAFSTFLKYFTVALGAGQVVFLFKIHGDCKDAKSCIDTERQRLQGLPSFVTSVLNLLLRRTTMTFLGFSGTDLATHPNYIRIISSADVANIRWLLRESDAEPDCFPAFREKLGTERFQVIRGSMVGTINSSDKTIEERLNQWAINYVGSLRAVLTIHDLCQEAKLPTADVEKLLVGYGTGVPASPTIKSVSLLALFTQHFRRLSNAGQREADPVDFVATNLGTALTISTNSQEIITNEVRIINLARKSSKFVKAHRLKDALETIREAILMRRRLFTDSRDFFSAYKLLIVYAVVLDAIGLEKEATIRLQDAKDTAILAGDSTGIEFTTELLSTRKIDIVPVKSVAHVPGPVTENDLLVSIPAFDNTVVLHNGFSNASLLRAHLNRALLVGDYVAFAPNYFNNRSLITEVLFDSEGSLRTEILCFLRPLLPLSQVCKVKEKQADGKETVKTFTLDIRASPNPIMAYRLNCQVNMVGFLAEIIPDEFIAKIDAFYQAHPHLIYWYDYNAIGSNYPRRLLNLTNVVGIPEEDPRHLVYSAMKSFSELCLSDSYLTRSKLYDFGDLFEDGLSMAAFEKKHMTAWLSPEATPEIREKAQYVMKCRAIFQKDRLKYADLLKLVADSPYLLNMPLTFSFSMCADDNEMELVEVIKPSLAENDGVEQTEILDYLNAGQIRVFELARLDMAQLVTFRESKEAVSFRNALRVLNKMTPKTPGFVETQESVVQAGKKLFEFLYKELPDVDSRPLLDVKNVGGGVVKAKHIAILEKISFTVNMSSPIQAVFDIPRFEIPGIFPAVKRSLKEE